MTIIKGITILAIDKIELKDPVTASLRNKLKSIFSSYKTMFTTKPEIMASDNLIKITINKLTPVLLATADSTNRLWEKDSITAKIVACLTVKDKLAMAPMAAMRFIQLPKTSTMEASPGKPNIPITGPNHMEIIFRIPLNLKKVTKKYTGTIILVNLHKVKIPFFKPLLPLSNIILSTPYSYLVYNFI